MTYSKRDSHPHDRRSNVPIGDLGSQELKHVGPPGAEHIAKAATTLHQRAAPTGKRAMTGPVIALAADHAGFELKNSMKVVLDGESFPLVDLGPETADPVDYPDMAGKLAGALKDGRAQQGLLVCGSGIGIAIAANRYPWIRAAVCHDVTAARLAREHNDANVLALGARLIGPDVARDCLLTFLKTSFAGDRHARRVAKMSSPVP
jgi:ribose 5-phosphate isomerase B